MASVTISDLDKFFGEFHAIRGLNLHIEDGSFVALVGPSGCGKSTTLRMIAGLEVLTEGQISIGTRDVTDMAPRDRGVAMVFQNYALYPHMTVEDNLSFGLKVAGIAREECGERIRDAADLLEISGLMKRRPAQLSGGQRQRVAIGRALVRNPDVFLFDEPLSNLDAQLRNTMRTEIKKLHQRLNATIIFVTHDQIEAMTMADVIVVMRDGVIEQAGSPLDLFERPANQFVAGFIGAPAMRFFDGITSRGSAGIEIRLGPELSLPVDKERFPDVGAEQRVRVGIRPEDIVPQGYGMEPRQPVCFEASVSLSEPLGNETLLVTKIGEQEAMSRMYRPRPVRNGEKLRFTIDLERIHLFDVKSGGSLLREPETGAS